MTIIVERRSPHPEETFHHGVIGTLLQEVTEELAVGVDTLVIVCFVRGGKGLEEIVRIVV